MTRRTSRPDPFDTPFFRGEFDTTCECAWCQVGNKDHLLSWAWAIIANGHGGDWDRADPEWKAAAEKWRDAFHEQLVEVHHAD